MQWDSRHMPCSMVVVPPYMIFNTGGATVTIKMAITAPISIAVPHWEALARVSAPMIWPAA